MNTFKKVGLVLGLVALTSMSYAADPADLDALQTLLAGKMDVSEGFIITAFVIASAVAVGRITLYWVKKAGKGRA